MAEKKFLFPELYPIDRSIEREWFIQYKIEDFNTGNYLKRKYTGLLNMLPTVAEREKLAAQYIALMKAGKPLPKCTGKKKRSVDLGRVVISPQSNFADCIALCHRYLKFKSKFIDKKTFEQYTGQINQFDAWLTMNRIENRAIGAITRYTCEDYLLYLSDTLKLANSTWNNHKGLLGTIWQQHVDDGNIKGNPWRRIECLPENKRHFESYPPELRQLIREKLPQFDRQLWLFVQCIYYCAIRPHCELRLLKRSDLIFDKGLFVVPQALSYTGAKRAVNIYTELLQQFVAAGWMDAPGDNYLFTLNGQPGNKPAGINYFKNRWNAFKKAHGIPAIYKLYGSKHTGGKAVTVKFNSYVTKEHMRHKSIQSTEHYIDDLAVNELAFLQRDFPVF